MFRNGFIFRLIGVLLLIGLVAAGGFMAYKAGVAQGIAQAPEVAEAIPLSVNSRRRVGSSDAVSSMVLAAEAK